MSRMGVGSQIKTRLYLEGYHVPDSLLNVQVSGSVGGPATCQLSVVPTNTAKHIMPGTWVHVFVTDPWEPDPQGDLSDFRLLFEGVVVGRGFTKESGGRHLVLQCADPSIYWVNARQFWLNLAQSGGGLVNELAIQTSGGFGRFGTFGDQPQYGYFLSKISETNEERLLNVMVSVLDDIGNVNPFYNNQRNRFRITDRIVQISSGKTDQLFQIALLSDFLAGLAGRKSGQTNLAQLVNLLLAPIYHEWVSVPAPPFLKSATIFSRDVYGNIRKIPVKQQADGSSVTLNEFEEAADDIIAGTMFKPHVYSLSPPTCNVLFPNMFDHQSYSENFMVESTRVSMSPQFPLLKDQNNPILSSLQLLRPKELEIFRAITRENQVRGEDAKFGDGQGQTARLQDFDWTTNEERIRGIAYNFLNLPPAASTLTFTDQGATPPEGTADGKSGGVIKYLQNVASYEYYKSKFQSRSSSFTGPLNLRPVPGFPLLTLDDSDANLNIVAYLAGVTHSIDARGVGQTTYSVKYPRVLGEVDWNRPTFTNLTESRSETERIATDEQDQFRFERLFDGINRPAIPEWFGDEWRLIGGLNDTYRRFFGVNSFSGEGGDRPVGAIERVMFEEDINLVVSRLRTAQYPPSDKVLQQLIATIGEGEFNAEVGSVDLMEVATVLIDRYRKARRAGREFEEVSRATARPLARIDQAFRFVGAGPAALASDPGLTAQDPRNRSLDFTSDLFDRFVGDVTPGSGYAGKPITTGESSAGSPRLPQMNGSFPEFDITSHAEVTEAIRQSETDSTSAARYDGRPIMLDFERRLWEQSKRSAGAGVNQTADADAEVAQRETDTQQATSTTSHPPEEQAPTGEDLGSVKKLPLPEPLAEGQVVELRRRVVEAYRDELKQRRGFTG